MKFIYIIISILLILAIRQQHFKNSIQDLCECYEYYEKALRYEERIYIYTCDKTEYDQLIHEVFKVYVDCEDPVFQIQTREYTQHH